VRVVLSAPKLIADSSLAAPVAAHFVHPRALLPLPRSHSAVSVSASTPAATGSTSSPPLPPPPILSPADFAAHTPRPARRRRTTTSSGGGDDGTIGTTRSGADGDDVGQSYPFSPRTRMRVATPPTHDPAVALLSDAPPPAQSTTAHDDGSSGAKATRAAVGVKPTLGHNDAATAGMTSVRAADGSSELGASRIEELLGRLLGSRWYWSLGLWITARPGTHPAWSAMKWGDEENATRHGSHPSSDITRIFPLHMPLLETRRGRSPLVARRWKKQQRERNSTACARS